MNNQPAPTLTPPPPTDYRIQLNNWLQKRGWEKRLSWDQEWSDGPDDNPTWHAICRCPFHCSPRLLDAHLRPTVDNEEYGKGTGRAKRRAKEEAARTALRRLSYEEARPLLERNWTDQTVA